jgi:hypothetical protein
MTVFLSFRAFRLYSSISYFVKLTIEATIAAIEAMELLMPTAPAVVIFFRSPLLGTIISHPGSMAFAVFLLNRETVPFIYTT